MSVLYTKRKTKYENIKNENEMTRMMMMIHALAVVRRRWCQLISVSGFEPHSQVVMLVCAICCYFFIPFPTIFAPHNAHYFIISFMEVTTLPEFIQRCKIAYI